MIKQEQKKRTEKCTMHVGLDKGAYMALKRVATPTHADVLMSPAKSSQAEPFWKSPAHPSQLAHQHGSGPAIYI